MTKGQPAECIQSPLHHITSSVPLTQNCNHNLPKFTPIFTGSQTAWS